MGRASDPLLYIVVQCIFIASFDGLLNGWIVPQVLHCFETIARESVFRPDVLSSCYDLFVPLILDE